MSAVQIVLVLAAIPIGLTGAWSPCGFSMVETVGVRGEPSRGRTLAACVSFLPGAAIGGVVTFGALAALGGFVGGLGGRASYVLAAAIAVAAALLEARGVRIVPQIRRQLPEGWRWSLPLPLAAGLYGVLLGLGFTTFVLSFGVWALAAISFALGDPATGAAIGLAFGIGRAIPVVVLAPLADHRIGIRCTELMAERPSLYRRARLGDALALGVAAMVLVTASGSATAAHVAARPGADPSAAGGQLAFQRPSGAGVLTGAGGQHVALPGREPVIGGHLLADISKGRIEVRRRKTRKRIATLHAAGVDSMAISDSWLVFVQSQAGHDLLKASRLAADGTPAAAKLLVRLSHPVRIGHPSLDGAALIYALARPMRSQIVLRHLSSGHWRTVVSAQRAQLTNPSIRNDKVLFVRAIRERQSAQETAAPPLDQNLVLTDVKGHGARTLYSQSGGSGRLWTTALAAHKAYVTLLKGQRAKILRVDR